MQYIHVNNPSANPELSSLNVCRPPVKSLYIRGHYDSNIFQHCAAIVGSRRMTHYGRQVIDQLIPQLIIEGKTIVSGFMYGVDQYAHQTCINAGGKTIAVLGWGISNAMEEADTALAQTIIDSGGLIISEWEQQLGALWTFPARNRIVAGLCQDIYIIEAAHKSGSLLTAELALKYNKRLWAVPGPITSKTSQGTNQLIKDGKATMWVGTPAGNTLQTNDPILKLLENEPLTPNEIARTLHQTIAQTGATLSLLSMTNKITEREGKFYLNAHQT